jgi:hypothetical protein
MARLFITPRELDFISDVTKELIKDVSGQRVFYYRIREDVSRPHDVYEEAPQKFFDPPIEVDARVEYQPEEIRTNRFGTERFFSINVFIHERDMVDRDLEVRIGDYFSYGDIFFEITSAIAEVTIYGQIEHLVGYKIVGKQARMGQIDKMPIGPTNKGYKEDADSVQRTFVQQRGLEDNGQGETGDVRQLRENGVLDEPIGGPAEVSPRGDERGVSSSFYDEV